MSNKVEETQMVWDFVEQFYPNYTGSDTVALNDDLHKIQDSEDEEDSAAYKLKYETFPDWDLMSVGARKASIDKEVAESDRDLYLTAIESFQHGDKYGLFVKSKGQRTLLICLNADELDMNMRKTLHPHRECFKSSREFEDFIGQAKLADSTLAVLLDGTEIFIQKQ